MERDHIEHGGRRFSKRPKPLNRVDCYERDILLGAAPKLDRGRLGRVRRCSGASREGKTGPDAREGLGLYTWRRTRRTLSV